MIHKVTHSQSIPLYLDRTQSDAETIGSRSAIHLVLGKSTGRTKRPKRISDPWREPTNWQTVSKSSSGKESSKSTDAFKTTVIICCEGTLIKEHARVHDFEQLIWPV